MTIDEIASHVTRACVIRVASFDATRITSIDIEHDMHRVLIAFDTLSHFVTIDYDVHTKSMRVNACAIELSNDVCMFDMQ